MKVASNMALNHCGETLAALPNGADLSSGIPVDTLEKMRAENRERKKRWRENNEERNKDNDLRCRVNKRANKLYGEGPSEAKARWAEEEFQRRRSRRMNKETKRMVGGPNPNHLPHHPNGSAPNGGGHHHLYLPSSPVNGCSAGFMHPVTPGSSVPTTPMPLQPMASNHLPHASSLALPPLHLPPAVLSSPSRHSAAPSSSSNPSGTSMTGATATNSHQYANDRHAIARDFWKIVTDLKHDLSSTSSSSANSPSAQHLHHMPASLTSPVPSSCGGSPRAGRLNDASVDMDASANHANPNSISNAYVRHPRGYSSSATDVGRQQGGPSETTMVSPRALPIGAASIQPRCELKQSIIEMGRASSPNLFVARSQPPSPLQRAGFRLPSIHWESCPQHPVSTTTALPHINQLYDHQSTSSTSVSMMVTTPSAKRRRSHADHHDGSRGCNGNPSGSTGKPGEEAFPSGMVTPSSITNSPSLPPLSSVFCSCCCGKNHGQPNTTSPALLYIAHSKTSIPTPVAGPGSMAVSGDGTTMAATIANGEANEDVVAAHTPRRAVLDSNVPSTLQLATTACLENESQQQQKRKRSTLSTSSTSSQYANDDVVKDDDASKYPMDAVMSLVALRGTTWV
ncbi:hypothetical protein H4R33_001654 [Dimargaris cristalligena]|nr:hypothetical protein H4R33_001654 [Dimargaris cristalligena]